MAGGTAGIAMWSIAIPPDVSTSKHASNVCMGITFVYFILRLSNREYSLRLQGRTRASLTAHVRLLLLTEWVLCGKDWVLPWLE